MTIAGKQTAGEVREFIAEKTSEIQQISRGFSDEVSPILAMQDAAQNEELTRMLSALSERWNAAVTKVQASLLIKEAGANTLGNSILPLGSLVTGGGQVTAQDEFDTLLRALTATPGHFQAGDFTDIVNRISRACDDLHIPQIHVSVRQPNALDLDLEAFKGVDKTIREGEAGVAVTRTAVVDGLGDVLTNPGALLAIGGVGLGAFLAWKILR